MKNEALARSGFHSIGGLRVLSASALMAAIAVLLPAQEGYKASSGQEGAAPPAIPADYQPGNMIAEGEDHDGHDHAHHAGDGHDHGPGDGHHHGDGHDHAPRTIPDRPGFDFSIWDTVHIQEGGLEKSFYTYAVEHMRVTVGKVNYGGRGPVENVFSMALEPELWGDQAFLKVSLPELREAFGGKDVKKITPLQLDAKMRDIIPKLAESKEMEREFEAIYHKAMIMAQTGESLRIIPVVDVRGDKDQWQTVEQMSQATAVKNDRHRAIEAAWPKVAASFVRGDAAGFNQASTELVTALNSLGVETFTPEWKFRLDAADTRLAPFAKAGWIYLFSSVLFLVSYLAGRKMFTVAAGGALAVGTLVHIVALVLRGILAGRTPVANLFESAVFIIACMTALSVIISAYYRTRIVGLGGATLGAFFMGIANQTPLHYGRKIMPLVDALQSYWLHIHVTSMLLSYAFFALAFFVAGGWIVRSFVLRRRGVADIAADSGLNYLDGLNFRIITIGFPVLTAGVILGAVWAAEAWGRPWAFDPKETAAAITWMIYAIYLHCRLFLGWRGAKGIWLSVLGFAAVVFTYLGVSFFLPGLHSYVSEGMSFTEWLRSVVPGI